MARCACAAHGPASQALTTASVDLAAAAFSSRGSITSHNDNRFRKLG